MRCYNNNNKLIKICLEYDVKENWNKFILYLFKNMVVFKFWSLIVLKSNK